MANHPNRRKGYRRSVTNWHSTVDSLGRQVNYITSDEIGVPAAAVCSIYDPASDEPSYRLIWATGERRSFGEADEPYPAKGLVVLGVDKHSRPGLDEAAALIGIKGHIAVGAVRKAIDDPR